MLYLGLSHFFPGLQSTALATKDEHEASEVLNLPCGLIIMSQIKNADRFTHWEFRPFENVVQVYQILRVPRKVTSKATYHFDPPTPANVLATCRNWHVCRRDEKVSDVLHLSCQTTFYRNAPDAPHLPHETDITQKTSPAR
jgi:hypothetical protein